MLPWRRQCCHSLQGKSFRETEEQGSPAGTLRSHCVDLAAAIKTLPAPPILVGHSFGGLILQRYLVAHRDDPERFPAVAGVVLMGASPPRGTDLIRYMINAPIKSTKVRPCSWTGRFPQASSGLFGPPCCTSDRLVSALSRGNHEPLIS